MPSVSYTDYYYRYVSDSYCWLQIVTLLNVNGIESNWIVLLHRKKLIQTRHWRMSFWAPLRTNTELLRFTSVPRTSVSSVSERRRKLWGISHIQYAKRARRSCSLNEIRQAKESHPTVFSHCEGVGVTNETQPGIPKRRHRMGVSMAEARTLPYPRSPQRYVHSASIRHLLCIYWPTFLHAASNTIKRMPTTSGENESTASHSPCNKLHVFAGRLSPTPILVDWERICLQTNVCLQTNKQITSTVHVLTHQRQN